MITTNAATGHTLLLGREGENLARSMIFDIADWISAYGDGTASLIAQRSGDTEPYPCTVTVDGSFVTWLVTAVDTARQGHGKCELRYAVGDVLVKSETWRTYTADALGTPAPEAPEPQKAWVDKVLAAGQAAVDASVNSPKIGSNGNWWTWDFGAGKYVDTGVAASGGGSGAVSSVNGKTGAVKLTAEDVGAVSVPETASVGQTIVVKAVGEAGKPTEWEAADMPSGGGSSLPATGVEDAGKVLTVTEAGVPGWADAKVLGINMRTIADITLAENANQCVFGEDIHGSPLSLRHIIVYGNLIKTANCYARVRISDGTNTLDFSLGRHTVSEWISYEIYLTEDGTAVSIGENSENRNLTTVINDPALSCISEIAVVVNGTTGVAMQTGSTITIIGR